MNILIALLVGAALGAGIGWWFRRSFDYLVVDLLVGIGGAILGLALYFFTHIGEAGFWAFGGIVAAGVGAGACLLIYQLLLLAPKKKHKNVKHAAGESEK